MFVSMMMRPTATNARHFASASFSARAVFGGRPRWAKVAKAENNQKDRGSNSQAFGYVVGLDSCGCLSESAEECEEGKTETQEHAAPAPTATPTARDIGLFLPLSTRI